MSLIDVLIAELTNDPLGRGYSTMTAQEAADDLNTAYRTRNRTSMSGDEIFQQTDATEFAGLTDAKRLLWVSFTGKDRIDPTNGTNVAFLQFIFGGGSTTGSNLASARMESISRATELGLPVITPGFVEEARRG